MSSSNPLPPGIDLDAQQQCSHDNRSRPSYKEYDKGRRERGRDDFKRYATEDSRSKYENNKDSDDEGFYSRSSTYSRDYNRRPSYRDRSVDHHHDRSRDRDRDRDKDREYSKDRDRDREHSRDRERDWERILESDWQQEIPTNTIIIKGMAPHLTEDDLHNEITRYSLYPKDIVLMRKKNSGESRGFAFIEFRFLSDAVRWKELTKGEISFGDCNATLHYCVARDTPVSDRPMSLKADWTCAKCGVNNFRKRDLCFKCNAPRELSLSSEGLDEVSTTPSNTLLFRNLDILTTEERVLFMLGQVTVLPIKNVKIAKNSTTNTSRGFAYVELHSTSEAEQLHDLLISMGDNFYVDGRQVTVSYSRTAFSSLNVANADESSTASSSQDQYGQIQNQNFQTPFDTETNLSTQQNLSNTGNLEEKSKYTTPDPSLFHYDKSSGYYYDSNTGFYYDANSHYYYNPTTQQYLYWDSETKTYVPAPSTDATSTSAVIEAPATKNTNTQVISSSAVITASPALIIKKDNEAEKSKEKINPQDKVKFAKKVAKDMEKWAKTLNQKKENAKLGIITSASPQILPVQTISTSDDNSTPNDKKVISTNIITKETKERKPSKNKDKASLTLIATYGDESDSDPENEMHDEGQKIYDILKAEEARLLDWNKLACLLCKRQFPTKEILTKHIQMSDLHKQNVDMLKLTKLTPYQLKELEKKESGYRDRAKERREKFGQPDIPPPSRLKTKYYMKERKEPFIPPEQPNNSGIGSDNIGNKMLKAMGWTEGQGLGKSGQGMSGIIEVQQRVKSAGLGLKGSSYGAGAGDSYKDAVRKSMQARYNEIA